MSPLPPSRRDNAGPGRNVTDLSALVRHDRSYLRSLDPGFLDGRFATPQPVPIGPGDLVGDDGGDGAGGGDDVAAWNTDEAYAGEHGSITLNLTYEPIDGSLHIRWNGVDQPPTEWTLDGQTVTFTSSLVRTGHRLTAAYLYDNGEIAEPSGVVVDFGYTLWRWLGVPFHDPGDYSDPLYDDSAWPVGTAPFGDTTPDHDPLAFPDWPDYVTVWDQNTQMWARATVAAEPGIPITIRHRLNRTRLLWWNGDYRGKTTAAELTGEIPADLVLASNVVVFKISDDGFTGIHTGCYFDAQISQDLS